VIKIQKLKKKKTPLANAPPAAVAKFNFSPPDEMIRKYDAAPKNDA